MTRIPNAYSKDIEDELGCDVTVSKQHHESKTTDGTAPKRDKIRRHKERERKKKKQSQ